MNLLQFKDIHLSYGPRVLLENASLAVSKGDCIGLLGRNGEGKSSLLKLLAGIYQADEGEIVKPESCGIAYLPQDLPEKTNQTVYAFIAGGMQQLGEDLVAYYQAAEKGDLEVLEKLQQRIELVDGWNLDQKIQSWLTELGLNREQCMKDLSGGWLRRVSLARALITEPDILLLDEPTNHLDVEAIEWLENLIKRFQGAVFLITHDRRFLQTVCNAILELDRGQLIEWRGDYQGFLRFRDERLHSEEKQNALFDKKLAEEEAWIRQGIKARRTRNEGRVRALKTMREEYRQRRKTQGKAKAEIEQAGLSGKLVVEAQDISFAWSDGKPVFEHFSTVIMRGDRIGLLGPNGAGKTTLLKVLLGELQPQQGQIKPGVNLEVAYFDQKREALDMDKSVIDNVSGGRDFIELNGKKRHIISYLQDFLFPPERVRQPARALSGGEQNRLMLATLFSKPANLLVLDEPTNDLDLETLELLEELLMEFTGTVFLVSHDREFVDNVVTRSYLIAGDGEVEECIGGYSDCEEQLKSRIKALKTSQQVDEKNPPSKDKTPPTEKSVKKLSYKLQRELDALPEEIEQLESGLAELESRVSGSEFYQQEQAVIQQSLDELAAIQSSLEEKMERWLELEAMQQE